MTSYECDLRAIKVSIGIPCGSDVPWQTALSLAKTVQVCALQGISAELNIVAGCSIVTRARSLVLDQFLKGTANRLFWIDADVVWEPADFFKMLAHSTVMDVVCGAYPMRGGAHAGQFTIQHPDLENFELNNYGCVKIEGIGMGFSIMTREVVERVAASKPKLRDRAHGTQLAEVFRVDTVDEDYARGEDMAFFADVRELGFPVWLDPTINVGHVGSHVFRANAAKSLHLEHIYRPEEA
jgi:hypothetical protein